MIGSYNEELSYALSEKAEGQRIDSIDPKGIKQLIPSIVSTLKSIHSAPIQKDTGYGFWSAEFSPASKSWGEFLLASALAQFPEGRTHPEKTEINSWRERFIELCSRVPDVHQLVHGDFGFGNAFANSEGVTSVIDWAESMFGDPLYDIAWIEFWYRDKSFLNEYLLQIQDSDFNRAGLDERMECYLLRTGLRSLYHFESSKQDAKGDWTVVRLREVINGS